MSTIDLKRSQYIVQQWPPHQNKIAVYMLERGQELQNNI